MQQQRAGREAYESRLQAVEHTVDDDTVMSDDDSPTSGSSLQYEDEARGPPRLVRESLETQGLSSRAEQTDYTEPQETSEDFNMVTVEEDQQQNELGSSPFTTDFETF